MPFIPPHGACWLSLLSPGFCSFLLIAAVVTASVADASGSGERAKPFFTSLGEEFDEPLNRMWRIYGSVSDGTEAVIRFGNEPAWFEWMARKLMWTDEFEYRSGLYNRISQVPMSANGYVWSWANRPDWPTEPGAYHQENNAKFILSIYRHLVWSRDLAFLEVTDPRQVQHQETDVSYGMAMLEKVRLAMDYQLEDLKGREGLLVVDNDHNTGRPDGAPTNYWDNFPFGYKDAYINAYFYASLLAMAGIEEMAGQADRAQEHRQLAARVREVYSRTFWDEEKGRFIGCVDVDGKRWDLGFTFLNLEALTYSLAAPGQAEAVLRWLDGDRIVEGDTSTGADIYYFGWAPRATTVDVAKLGEPYWWKPIVINGVPQITVWEGGSATFGEHLENGGAIFYVSHYDVIARAKHRGADDAWRRFNAIMDEFRIDELRRDPTNNVGANWKIGITGVFPESGLVPASFLYAFLGIDADVRGLNIRPNLPSALEYAGVRDLSFGRGLYDVQVWRNRMEVVLTNQEEQHLQVVVGNLSPETAYETVVYDPERDHTQVRVAATTAAGELLIDVRLRQNFKVTVQPAGS
jgi:hypothetical protein